MKHVAVGKGAGGDGIKGPISRQLRGHETWATAATFQSCLWHILSECHNPSDLTAIPLTLHGGMRGLSSADNVHSNNWGE